MPLVQAYQCPHTGKLFSVDDVNLYRAHLKKLARERNMLRTIQQHQQNREQFLESTLWSLTSIAEIEQWALNNTQWLECNGIRDDKYAKKRSYNREPLQFLEFNLDVKWSACLSNTHNAPRNGVTNWSGSNRLPRGYPGYEGNLSFVTNRKVDFFPTDMFRDTCINLGAGSGSNNNYRFNVMLFDDDWQALKVYTVLTAC